MIEFKNVVKKYSTGTEAVHNANFRINKGDFAFLVGASGSGKSTLIKLILKEEEPTSGNIVINGGTIDITGNSPFDYDGKAEYNGGTIIVNGTKTNTITNQMMGGPRGQERSR